MFESETPPSPAIEEDAAENDDYRLMIRQQLAAVAQVGRGAPARGRGVQTESRPGSHATGCGAVLVWDYDARTGGGPRPQF